MSLLRWSESDWYAFENGRDGKLDCWHVDGTTYRLTREEAESFDCSNLPAGDDLADAIKRWLGGES